MSTIRPRISEVLALVELSVLTDEEKEALSYAFHNKHIETDYVRYLNDPTLSDLDFYARKELIPSSTLERVGRLRSAQQSLIRFGLLQGFHLTCYKRGEETCEMEQVYLAEEKRTVVHVHMPDGELIVLDNLTEFRNEGWRYSGWGHGARWNCRLTNMGTQALAAVSAFAYKCCDGCVALNCVCRERTFCAEHGGGCHGTHD